MRRTTPIRSRVTARSGVVVTLTEEQAEFLATHQLRVVGALLGSGWHPDGTFVELVRHLVAQVSPHPAPAEEGER